MKLAVEQREAARILFGLCCRLCPHLSQIEKWYFSTYIKTAEKWIESEGNQGIKRLKVVNTLTRNVIWFYEPRDIQDEQVPFLSVNQRGWPTLTVDLIAWWEKELRRIPESERVLDDPSTPFSRLFTAFFSLVSTHELYRGEVTDHDVLTNLDIIKKCHLGGTTEFQEFREFLDRWGGFPSSFRKAQEAFESPLVITDSDTVMYSEKVGPNGPLTENSHKDYLTLTQVRTSSGESLLHAVNCLQEDICAFTVESWKAKDSFGTTSLGDLRSTIPHSDFPGKLTFIPEKAGKVRVVASPDYFSQLTLRPVHRWLSSILRAIPSDCTYDQSKALPKIQNWQRQRRYIASFDQSQCTDRFPFQFQLEVIRKRFGDKFATDLQTVMVDRDWSFRLPSGNHGVVRWNTGQPMGLYASWPLMAVSHHLLVQFAAWKAFGKPDNFQGFHDYVICGDDIVMTSERVCNCYQQLCSSLGMAINLSKSWISPRGSVPTSEFTKRLVRDGCILDRIRPNMVLSAVKDPSMVIPLFRYLVEQSRLPLRRRDFVAIINKFFPGRSNLLTSLLSVPSRLGGVGLKDARSLKRDWFLSTDEREIHPWLYVIATKARSKYVTLQQRMRVSAEKILDDLTPPGSKCASSSLTRFHPLLEIIRDFNDHFPRKSLLDSKIKTVPKIALEIMSNEGQGLIATRLLMEETDYTVPPWKTEQTKEAKTDLRTWHKALKRPHMFPSEHASRFASDYLGLVPGIESYMYGSALEASHSKQNDRLIKLLTVLMQVSA